MSAVHAVRSEEEASAERWRQWQSQGAVASRSAARRALIVFVLLFAGLGAWLALMLFDPSLWP